METLPRKADSGCRVFKQDNEWLKREAKKRHTIVAVIIHELITEYESKSKLI